MNQNVVMPAGPLLVVSVSPGYGGAERSIEIILRHLPPGQRAAVIAESPLHLQALRQIARPNLHIAAVASTDDADFGRAVQRFIALYLRLRPAAVLANTSVSARILAAATRWLPGLGARSFVYVRDFLWPDLGQTLQPLVGATILVPHQVVLERQNYLEPFIAPRGPLRALVVPDMVELPAQGASPPGAGPLLHLATVNPWKGHAVLISAAALLRACGTPVQIRSIGYRPDAALHAALEQQIAVNGLQGLLTLEPYVPDPGPDLKACRGVVVSSGTAGGGPETFGRAIIEAWAHARPVIAVAAGAPARLINHEQDGLLVPEGDVSALADALHRLATDDALCARLAQAGLARARAEFAADMVVPRLLAVLAGEAAAMPLPAPEPGILLDLTRTLEHGWLTPMGMSRVEAEVFEALYARPDLRLGLLRHDPARGGYRSLDRAETEWVNQRFGVSVPVPDGPGLPAPDGPRQQLLGLAGLIFFATPRWLWQAIALGWRVAQRLRRALPVRFASSPSPTGHPLTAVLPEGRVLVSVANPWDYAAPSVFQAWRASGRSAVMVVHDLLAWEVPQLTDGREVKGFLSQALATLAQANHLVAVSAHSAAAYGEAAADIDFRSMVDPVDPADISIAHPGIVPSLRRGSDHAAMPPALADGRPFILFCSTIEVRKNHLLLLRVWDRLRRKLPATQLPRLVFVGRWGWGVEPVRIWLQRDWRLAPHLHVLEGVADDTLALLYRQALFTVFPSFAEGFGMPVAESLACGTPVVTGTHPALREACEGLMPMIDPDDLAAWEGEILGLITAPERLAALRAAAATYRGPAPGILSRTVAEAAARLLQAKPAPSAQRE